MATSAFDQRRGRSAPAAAIGHAEMRTANMGLVLRRLHEAGARSRTALAQDVGLSKAAISSIITDLAERGLVREERTESRGRVGRPGIDVIADGGHVCGIGLEINVDYIMAAVVDFVGEVREIRTEPMPAETAPDAVMEVIARLIAELVQESRERGMWVAGAVMAPPGVIDDSTGVLRFAPNLGWRDIPLLARMRELLGPGAPPLGLENDAKLSAVAAYASFAGEGVEDLVFLTGDVGVGAGIIVGGRLARGWSGFSGEVGHMRIHENGLRCRCGRSGCWEMYVGLPVLLDATPTDSPARRTELTMPERLEAVRAHLAAGEEGVTEALAGIIRELIRGAGTLVDVLNPRVLVLGGYLGELGDLIQEPLQAALDARRLDEGGGVHVACSDRGLAAAAVGGAIAALEVVLEDPGRVPIHSA